MQINVTNPATLVAAIAANFGAMEPITIIYSPIGFLVLNVRRANADPARDEKVVFNGYGAEFSQARFEKMIQAYNIPLEAAAKPKLYAILKTEYDVSRLPVSPGRIIAQDLLSEDAANQALTGFFETARELYSGTNFVTKPGFWCFNVLRSQAPGDRCWINYGIIETK